MNSPTNRSPRVVLGVAGGIAAYKAVELLRLLRDRGYVVSPVLTPDATRFVGAVTFSALASEPVRTSLYGDTTTPIPHTYLGQNADVIVIAPATAHVIARLAVGLADDLLCATVLASRAPIVICPAMHTEMWEQPSVQGNLATLRARGYLVLPPESGALAGGDAGTGRLPEPEKIAELVTRVVDGWRGPLSGRRVVVTAGGTREPVDPVRVMTNRSSGHQGYALAEVAARWGASVQLISTTSRPVALDVATSVDVVAVGSAAEMATAVQQAADTADVVIMAAAVADFTFDAAPEKLKKSDGIPALVPLPTADIVGQLVANRRPGQLVVGFAAETTDVERHATEKLARKPVDVLVVNDVSAEGVGFEHTTNEVLLLTPSGESERVSLRSKEAVAEAVLTKVASLLH